MCRQQDAHSFMSISFPGERRKFSYHTADCTVSARVCHEIGLLLCRSQGGGGKDAPASFEIGSTQFNQGIWSNYNHNDNHRGDGEPSADEMLLPRMPSTII